MEQKLLDKLLARCMEKGWLHGHRQQRTDSTHVLAAIRKMNRLELIGETLRAALKANAAVAPNWLSSVVSPDWFDRYSRRLEDYRLPESQEERHILALTIGADGHHLLNAIYALL